MSETTKTRRSVLMRGYYRINRRYWPEMSRPRAAWSAWRTYLMTRKHR